MSRKPLPHPAAPATDATTDPTGVNAPGNLPPDQDEAFLAYWRNLLESGEALSLYRDHHKMRGLTFADFREAMADAFRAGRTSNS